MGLVITGSSSAINPSRRSSRAIFMGTLAARRTSTPGVAILREHFLVVLVERRAFGDQAAVDTARAGLDHKLRVRGIRGVGSAGKLQILGFGVRSASCGIAKLAWRGSLDDAKVVERASALLCLRYRNSSARPPSPWRPYPGRQTGVRALRAPCEITGQSPDPAGPRRRVWFSPGSPARNPSRPDCQALRRSSDEAHGHARPVPEL